jgi:hypothetical protein
LQGFFYALFLNFFAFLFVVLGKRFLGTDVLGKIYNAVGGGEKNFNQYFLGGDDIAEKSKIFNYVVFFIIAIVVLNFISFQVNKYL